MQILRVQNVKKFIIVYQILKAKKKQERRRSLCQQSRKGKIAELATRWDKVVSPELRRLKT